MDNTVINLTRLLGITAVGASIAKARLVQRFVRDAANIITLAIVTGIASGALLIGALYIAYQGFVYYGLQPLPAQIVVAGITILTVGLFIGITASRLRHLRGIPEQILHTEFPLASHINKIADSFMEGLLNEPKAD